MKYWIRRLAIYKIISSQVEDVGHSSFKNIIYKLGASLARDLEFPFQINIEISRACNYNCPFCARTEADLSGNHIDFELVKKIVDEATYLKKPTLFALHMWGEPLLNPKWAKTVRYIKSSTTKHSVTMTTNGFLLNDKNIESIIKSQLDQVIISLHTFDPNIYKVRIGKDIDIKLIEQNISNLLQSVKVQSKKTRVIIRLFLSSEERKIQADKIQYFKDKGAVFEFDLYDNSAGDRKDWSEIEPVLDQVKRWPCYHPWLTATVNVYGEVTVCCVDSKMALKIGNLTDIKLGSIWKGELIKDIRGEHKLGQFSEKCSICKNCDTWVRKPDIFFK